MFAPVYRQVTLTALVSLLGGNASGKSTTLKTILGLVQPRNGSVEFRGEEVTGRTTSYRIRKGMAIVPENRRLFGPMTVLENLEMGAYLIRDTKGRKEDFERVYTLFPLLHERLTLHRVRDHRAPLSSRALHPLRQPPAPPQPAGARR